MKTNRLQVHRTFDVPLREVSGICLRRGLNCATWLIAVGDREAKLAQTRVSSSDDRSPDWQIMDISRLPGSELPAHDPQIEAVCADGAGRVLLLQEAPARAELIDLDAARVVASISLEVDGKHELARSWSDPKGSHGEGAVLLANGHLLVAKEKKPAALIEFGPRGSRSQGLAVGGALADGAAWPVERGNHSYIAVAIWSPDKALRKACADFSDLEIGLDGRLYVLSDQSASIAQIGDLLPEGDTATLTTAWRLENLDDKPEGLAFAPTGHAIVALDKRKRRNNLVLLEPAVAPSPVCTKTVHQS